MNLIEDLTEEQQAIVDELLQTSPVEVTEPTLGGYTRIISRTYSNDVMMVEELYEYQNPPMDKAWGALQNFKINYYAE